MKPTVEQRKIAAENGISYETLLRRLAEDWPMKQAINIPVNAHRVLTDEDIQQAASIGVSYGTLYNRINDYGWDIERAISTPVMPRSKRAKKRGGKVPAHLVKLAEANGIPYRVLYKRLYIQNWDEGRAVTQSTKRKRVLTEKQEQTMNRNKLSINTVMTRINRLGWDADKAVSTPTRKPKGFTDEQLELMARNGVSANLVHLRVGKLGWSLEKAVSTPVQTKKTS